MTFPITSWANRIKLSADTQRSSNHGPYHIYPHFAILFFLKPRQNKCPSLSITFWDSSLRLLEVCQNLDHFKSAAAHSMPSMWRTAGPPELCFIILSSLKCLLWGWHSPWALPSWDTFPSAFNCQSVSWFWAALIQSTAILVAKPQKSSVLLLTIK